jgi:hemerythrin
MIEDSGPFFPTDSPHEAASSAVGVCDPSSPGRDRPRLHYAEWSDKLEMGLPLIDQQHKRFFDLAASFSGQGDEVRVMKTLAILSDYIRSHLRDEEALMVAAHYPGLEAHRRLHAEFRHMLADLLGRARKMSLDEIAEEVKYLVNGWFYNHIVTVDFEYAPYLIPGHPSRPLDPAHQR